MTLGDQTGVYDSFANVACAGVNAQGIVVPAYAKLEACFGKGRESLPAVAAAQPHRFLAMSS